MPGHIEAAASFTAPPPAIACESEHQAGIAITNPTATKHFRDRSLVAGRGHHIGIPRA